MNKMKLITDLNHLLYDIIVHRRNNITRKELPKLHGFFDIWSLALPWAVAVREGGWIVDGFHYLEKWYMFVTGYMLSMFPSLQNPELHSPIV